MAQLHLEIITQIIKNSLSMITIDSMIDKKYMNQIGGKKCVVLDKKIIFLENLFIH